MLANHIITLENDGPQLVRTNYWDSPMASLGAFYVSVNANAIRVLVPKEHEHFIADMHTAHEVVATRGDWPAAKRKDALELMWDDGSDDPYALFIGPEQLDRLIPRGNVGSQMACLVYVRGYAGTPLLKGDWPAHFRTANTLPCLRPWGQ